MRGGSEVVVHLWEGYKFDGHKGSRGEVERGGEEKEGENRENGDAVLSGGYDMREKKSN